MEGNNIKTTIKSKDYSYPTSGPSSIMGLGKTAPLDWVAVDVVFLGSAKLPLSMKVEGTVRGEVGDFSANGS